MTKGHVLVTGGCGYIGTHTLVVLISDGYKVTVADNLVNSKKASLERVKQITGCGDDMLRFVEVDLCSREATEKMFEEAKDDMFMSVIHFAALKAVGESTQIPLKYYENNIGNTVNLLQVMEQYGCRSFIFSSSATVYGSAPVPYTESSQTGVGVTNAYGRTKFMIEEILKDHAASPAGKNWSICLLRYFNPCGAHPTGLIGEDPQGIPNNLMPYVVQVAVGRRDKLTVFGDDFPTKDGTGVRDYIHVMDLAEGHLAAMKYLEKSEKGIYTFNLGSGEGTSVLEMIEAMRKASGKEVPYVVGPKREGDLPAFWADPAKAEQELGWKVKRGLDEMCADLWKWQSQNPKGYEE
eukprot:TRINITY_DN26109_c0_g1_i1.p1 TRINITY_DN26109_c0_g1~~TRINITY_DN26109_c0_g1_i1.p1  ORF type:complete len:351 (+),score=128.11 TRINITY_DN26109_c0_g1_i1:44-1096(+)